MENKNTDNIARVIALFSILIAGFSAYYSYKQYSTTEELNYLHIKPEILADLSYPKDKNPTLKIYNNSPIEIV
ncbi:hypothetical protein LCGC14_2084600, partial [marine sediment metagenome]